MKKSREKDIYEDTANKNFAGLSLLVSIKSFSQEVAKIRNEFGIPDGGLGDPLDGGLSGRLETLKWMKENNVALFNPAYTVEGSYDFRDRVFTLCRKYNVPEHYFDVLMRGVPFYIIAGLIIPPSENWQLIPIKDSDSVHVKISSYLPANQANDLARTVNEILKSRFKHSKKTHPLNFEHEQFYRDLELYNTLKNRKTKPKKIKKFVKNSYLDILYRQSRKTDEQWKKAIKSNAHDIVVSFSEITNKELGSKKGISGNAVSQAAKRLNRLCKELYGCTLEE